MHNRRDHMMRTNNVFRWLRSRKDEIHYCCDLKYCLYHFVIHYISFNNNIYYNRA